MTRKGTINPIYLIIFAVYAVALVLFVIGSKFIISIRSLDARSTINFELAGLVLNPYGVAQPLSVMKVDERTVAEIALQTSITEKISSEDTGKLDASIRDYMARFSFPYYNIKIIKSDKVLYAIDSKGRRCGKNDEGFCSAGIQSFNAPCGIGRRKIDSDGKCPLRLGVLQVYDCCAEDYKPGTEQYNEPLPGKPAVIRCGETGIGVCDFLCGEGRTEISQVRSECSTPQTQKCCAPVNKIGSVKIGTLLSAEIPLPYKTEKTPPVFYCVDSSKQELCSGGELVPGLCSGAKLCCVTQTIKCGTSTGSSGFCLDVMKCGKIQNSRSEISKDCPASRGNTYQCCITADLSSVKTGPPIQPTDEECNFGEKKSAGVGKLVITLGEK
ncbi:MAG: hypothetical protein HY518_00355 [Candidatus Aenigmarchaeota archaeon]|nr:hypothetical protein [Candidatus Aenigmarchaeota archaeon]